MASWSRWALGVSYVAAVGTTLRVYSSSPDVVPVHYGASGRPDRWGAPLEVLLVHGLTVSVSTAVFLALPELVRRAPSSLINLPNKAYWLTREHRGLATAKLAHCANVLGTAVNSLILTVQLLFQNTVVSAAGTPNQLSTFTLAAFLAFTLAWCVWLVRSYRLPASH